MCQKEYHFCFLIPNRTEGLVKECIISKIQTGNDTLTDYDSRSSIRKARRQGIAPFVYFNAELLETKDIILRISNRMAKLRSSDSKKDLECSLKDNELILFFVQDISSDLLHYKVVINNQTQAKWNNIFEQHIDKIMDSFAPIYHAIKRFWHEHDIEQPDSFLKPFLSDSNTININTININTININTININTININAINHYNKQFNDRLLNSKQEQTIIRIKYAHRFLWNNAIGSMFGNSKKIGERNSWLGRNFKAYRLATYDMYKLAFLNRYYDSFLHAHKLEKSQTCINDSLFIENAYNKVSTLIQNKITQILWFLALISLFATLLFGIWLK